MVSYARPSTVSEGEGGRIGGGGGGDKTGKRKTYALRLALRAAIARPRLGLDVGLGLLKRSIIAVYGGRSL